MSEEIVQDYDLTVMNRRQVALAAAKMIGMGTFGFAAGAAATWVLSAIAMILLNPPGAVFGLITWLSIFGAGGLVGLVKGVSSAIKDLPDPKAQTETAKELIKLGKHEGVRELKIRLSNSALLGLGSSVEGIPINIGYRGDNISEIEVIY